MCMCCAAIWRNNKYNSVLTLYNTDTVFLHVSVSKVFSNLFVASNCYSEFSQLLRSVFFQRSNSILFNWNVVFLNIMFINMAMIYEMRQMHHFRNYLGEFVQTRCTSVNVYARASNYWLTVNCFNWLIFLDLFSPILCKRVIYTWTAYI